MTRGPVLRLGLLLLAASAGACASPPTDVAPPGAPPATEITIGASVGDLPIRCLVHGNGEEVVLFLASIHGNEAAGTPLLLCLAEELERRPELLAGRTVLLVPEANPDGLAAGTRTNAHGIDLNRNFPSGNFRPGRRQGREPLSEPESRALHGLLDRHPPSRVVTIHQPLRLVDHDGPGAALARAMADSARLPARRLGSRPGSLGSYVGLTLGHPIVTVELPRDADRMTDDELWERYGPMLLTAITWSGTEHPGASR